MQDPEALTLGPRSIGRWFHTMRRDASHFRGFRDAGKLSAGVFPIAQFPDVGTVIEELPLV